MKRNGLAALLSVLVAGCATTMDAGPGAGTTGATVSDRVKQLTRGSAWREVSRVAVQFDTQHPQGMVRIGDHLYVSSVEIVTPTKRFATPQGPYDRDTGAGVGHLFKMDLKGNLVDDLKLGEGAIYHPGGIDYDGRYLWVPVAEYRPNSRAIVYRVDPATMQATEMFRYGDHVGGIVYNADDRSLHGVSWGSRRYYRWPLGIDGRVGNVDVAPEKLRVANRAHYIDYQDCKYLGRREMLCSGLTNYQVKPDAPRFALGGIEIVDLSTNLAIHQVPIQLWTASGFPMTQNPVWLEPTAKGLRAYFMPEDGRSTLYIYEVDVP